MLGSEKMMVDVFFSLEKKNLKKNCNKFVQKIEKWHKKAFCSQFVLQCTSFFEPIISFSKNSV